MLAGCGIVPPRTPPLAKVPRIGLLAFGAGAGSAVETFKQGLGDLGYGHGAVEFENQSTDRADLLPERADELVRRDVDVIVAWHGELAQAARRATSSIPIVVPNSGDPVRSGVAASLAHPGGNVTGLSSSSRELSGKRLELLRDTVAGISRPAVLWNPGSPDAALGFLETESAANVLGLSLQSLEVRGPSDFSLAFEAAARTGADALIVLGDPLLLVYGSVVVSLAARTGMPAMYDQASPYLAGGGLMAYGANLEHLSRRAATYVDKILRGAKPTDLPIEQPTVFDLVVNLRTAQTLGLTIPPSVLQQATEVIQ